jgi:hypothetical protein
MGFKVVNIDSAPIDSRPKAEADMLRDHISILPPKNEKLCIFLTTFLIKPLVQIANSFIVSSYELGNHDMLNEIQRGALAAKGNQAQLMKEASN